MHLGTLSDREEYGLHNVINASTNMVGENTNDLFMYFLGCNFTFAR
jgi:hypothetical protein